MLSQFIFILKIKIEPREISVFSLSLLCYVPPQLNFGVWLGIVGEEWEGGGVARYCWEWEEGGSVVEGCG
jgi:hypothetical protein